MREPGAAHFAQEVLEMLEKHAAEVGVFLVGADDVGRGGEGIGKARRMRHGAVEKEEQEEGVDGLGATAMHEVGPRLRWSFDHPFCQAFPSKAASQSRFNRH